MSIIAFLKSFLKTHPIISAIVGGVVIVGGILVWNGTHKAVAQTSYSLAAVTQGTIVSSVTGSGQVSASDQLDVKPKVSGDVTYAVPESESGQEVKAGTLLVEIDPTDAEQAIRSAQISLQNSQISLQKLQLSQQSDVPSLQNGVTNATTDLANAYKDGFTDVSNAFLDLPDIIKVEDEILFDSTVQIGDTNFTEYSNIDPTVDHTTIDGFITKAKTDYTSAQTAYDPNLISYNSASQTSDTTTIANLIDQTLATTQAMSDAAKSEDNVLNTLVTDINNHVGSLTAFVPAQVTTYQNDLSSDISQLNSIISNLTDAKNTIVTNTQNLASAQTTLANAQQSNPLDLESAQSAVAQSQVALDNANTNLTYYYIRAPFDGVIAKIDVKTGDSASSGTAVATMVSQQQIAVLSLNEVDATKVAVGQPATMTFDALPGLTIAGHVDEVDTIGTVSQGVVSYSVEISFDTVDSDVKPGMSVTAAIVTDSVQDALTVPNGAVKTSGGMSYVLVPQDQTTAQTLLQSQNAATGVVLDQSPRQQTVQVGLANDTETQITSGLAVGDVVVVRTITGSSAAAASSTTGSAATRSLFPTTGGAVRGATGGTITGGGTFRTTIGQ